MANNAIGPKHFCLVNLRTTEIFLHSRAFGSITPVEFNDSQQANSSVMLFPLTLLHGKEKLGISRPLHSTISDLPYALNIEL